MKQLVLRLTLLAEHNVITETTKEKILKMITFLNSEYHIVLNEENGGRFITHLAMAMTRIEKDEAITEASETMIREIEEEENFNKVKCMVEEIEKNIFEIEFPRQEKYFILANLLAIMGEYS